VAWNDVTLLVITKQLLLKLLKRYPKVKTQMKEHANEKRDSFQKSIQECVKEYLQENEG
jgi:hypothetical protein